MHVLFVEPSFPSNQPEFVRGLAEAGAQVTGIGEAPAEALPRRVRDHLYGYEQVPSVVHEASLLKTVQRIQAREWVDRLEARGHPPPALRGEAGEIPYRHWYGRVNERASPLLLPSERHLPPSKTQSLCGACLNRIDWPKW